MDGNECKTKENIHNNKRKLKITWEKKLPTTYTLKKREIIQMQMQMYFYQKYIKYNNYMKLKNTK